MSPQAHRAAFWTAYQLFDKIDCGLAVTCENLSPSRSAYLREEAYSKSCGAFSDPSDEQGNGLLLELYVDGELKSSIRVRVAKSLSLECVFVS
jgi:hypothetical protein